MKRKCPHCGAETTEQICEYCGSSIQQEEISETPTKINVIPFTISQDEAINFLYKRLVEENDVPLDIFNHIKIERVEKYVVPMFLFNGAIEGSWSATILNEKSRQVQRNGQQYTEYYTEYVPITGNLNSAFWLMSSSNQKTATPPCLLQYIGAVDFSEVHASNIISVDSRSVVTKEDCQYLESDSEPMAVFRSPNITNHLNVIATQVAMSQVPGKYQDLKLTWNATGDLKDTILLSVYFITFSYKGEEFSYCIDGVGASQFINTPKDTNPAKKLRRNCILKLIISVVLGIIAAFQAFGTSSHWIFVGIFFPFLMIFLTNLEWKKGLTNFRDLRECARKKFCNEHTTELQDANVMKWLNNTLIIAFALILLATFISRHTSTTTTEVFKEDTIPYSEQLLKEAERGDANAQLNMGRSYFFGNGVQQDYTKSFYWMKKAAEQGHYVAQHNLSVMYHGGHGTLKNLSLANEWVKKASDAGYAPSQYIYGMALANGEGVIQDKETATELIYEAAEKGFLPAKATLGHLYLTSGNINDGLYYTRSAAKENEPLALYDLGMCNIEGTGMLKNIDKGVEYLQKSAQLGYQPAIDELNRISSHNGNVKNDTIQMYDNEL